MVRKVSDQEAQAMQQQQAAATIRKLNRRIEHARQRDNHEHLDFLLACRSDVERTISV